MKSKNLSEYTLTIAVVLCSAILLSALTFALGGLHWQRPGRTLQIEMRDATSVKLHSTVRYAGVAAGTVSSIRYLTPSERESSSDPNSLVRIVVALYPGVPKFDAGITARLMSESLLGEKFVALVPGSTASGELPDGAVIRGTAPSGFEELTRSAQTTLGAVNNILAKLNTDYPALMPQVSKLLAQANNVATNAAVAVEHLDGIFVKVNGDITALIPKLEVLLDQGKTTLAGVQQTAQKAGGLIDHADQTVLTNQANLTQLITELRVTAQNLKVATTYAKALTATLGNKPSRLIWGFGETKLPTEQEILESAQPVPGKATPPAPPQP
jgi:ABC-type transporter Mla subunit MlaD